MVVIAEALIPKNPVPLARAHTVRGIVLAENKVVKSGKKEERERKQRARTVSSRA